MTNISEARQCQPGDNPRHKVWMEDASGLFQVTMLNPGQERFTRGGIVYEHTRELYKDGPWVYTRSTS